MTKLFKTKKAIILFTALVAVLFLSKTVFAVWSGTFYEPGDTLNPECLPTDVDCDVRSPLTSVNISDTAYGGTWDADATHASSKNAVYDKIETLATIYLPLAGGTLTGNLLFTDNTLDIGASGVTRPRTGYFGTSLVAPTINATTALQINSTTVLSGSTLGSTITASSLTSIGTLSSGAVPASLVTAGTFGTGAYVMDTSLTVPTVLGGIATTSDLNLKTTSGVGETGADMHFLVGNNGATEAMTILNSGNVGIGTTAPAAALDVYSNSLSLQLHRTGYSQTLDFYPAYSSLPTIIGAGGNGIKISGSLADNNGIYILASGNVGIGTAGPTKLLDVRGDAVLYSTNGSYAEGQSIFYTGTATTGGGLNLHAGAAGTATGSGTLKGFYRIRGTNGADYNTVMGIYGGAIGEQVPFEIAHATGDVYLAQSVGNVGIGTTGPGAPLEILKTAAGVTSHLLLTNKQTPAANVGWQIAWLGDPAGNITASAIRTAWEGAASTDSYLSLWTRGSNSITEKVRIDSTGNVGIGTAGPSSLLTINDTTAANASGQTSLVIDSNYSSLVGSGGRIAFRNSGVQTTAAIRGYIFGASLSGLAFETGFNAPTVKMVIDNSGNVGIGTTVPGQKLDINSATGVNLRLTYNDADGSAANYADLLTTSAGGLTLVPSGNLINIGGGTTATDLRFLEPSGSGTNYSAFKAVAQGADITYSLPPTVGGAGQQLTDVAGNGVLTWADAGSLRILKDIVGTVTDPTEALTQILSTPIYRFHYKMGKGTGDTETEYVGVMADEAQWAMHYGGTVVNPVNTLGYMVLGIQATNTKIAGLDLKINDFSELNNFDKENTWRDSLNAWFANATNRITRIFTGEVCLTKPGQEAVCLNRAELQSLKALLQNQNIPNPSTSSGSPASDLEVISDPAPEPEPEITTPTPLPQATPEDGQGGEDVTPIIEDDTASSPPIEGGVPAESGGGGSVDSVPEVTPVDEIPTP